MLNLIRNIVDKFCPKDTQISISNTDTSIGLRLTEAQANRQELLESFPNAPHSPWFVGANDIKQMIQEVKQMSSFEFYCSVKTNGQFDFKQMSQFKLGEFREFEPFGNWLFGVLTEARGINPAVRNIGTGAYQILSGTSSLDWDHIKNFGDDSRDRYNITLGSKDYLNYEKEIESQHNWVDSLRNDTTENNPRLSQPMLDTSDNTEATRLP